MRLKARIDRNGRCDIFRVYTWINCITLGHLHPVLQFVDSPPKLQYIKLSFRKVMP